MKRLFILGCLLSIIVGTASAQYTISIAGSEFNIELNDKDMTAAIRDYKYKIDDAKYPFRNRNRKFKQFGHESSRTVHIPETYVTAKGKEYTITTIGRAAFAGYQNMEYVVIPPTVTTIEDYAFFRTSLISVEIPASVTYMGKRIFGWCEKLKSLKIPQGSVMGNDVYAESKGIDVKYYTVADTPSLAQNKRKAKPAVQKKQIATSSDVDVDLPTTTKQNEEMFAIIIANEGYMNLPHVDCALNDGRTFKNYCNQVLGIPNENIRILEDATFVQMKEQVVWLAEVAKVYEGDSKIIIYYAGHGMPSEKDGSPYLLPIDNSGKKVSRSTAYSLNELYKELGAMNAKSITLFLDACFSGSQRGEGMLMADSGERGVARSYKAEVPIGNMVVFSASQGDQTAWPYAEKGHGLFTYYLLKKLKDTKGNVSYGVLGDYIKQQVSRKSVIVNSKSQIPSCQSSMKNWRNLTFK